MPVQSSTDRIDYAGNGATTAFAIPFYFLDPTQLEVILTDNTNPANPVVTTWTLNSQYTVAGALVSSGGTLTAATAPTSTQVLTILRDVPLTQLSLFLPNDPLPAATLNNALDQLTMIAQQQQEQLSRAISFPATPAAPDALLPTPVSGSVLGWVSGAWAWLSGASVTLAANLLTAATGMGTSLVNYLAPFTGAGGRLLNAKLAETVSVTDFGADPTGATSSTTAFVNALASGKRVYVPAGTFNVSSALTLSLGHKIFGESRYVSEIVFTGATNGLIMNVHSCIEDLRLIGGSTMTAANGVLCFGSSGLPAAYRSQVHRCIIGGTSTSLGDSVTTRCGGQAILGGPQSYLASFKDCYLFNAQSGYYNPYTGSQTNNALVFTSCEFQDNKIGAVLATNFAVKFDQCTFEGNDQEGLILGQCNGMALDGVYFEGNNTTANSPYKCDLYIGVANGMVGAGCPIGYAVSLKNAYFTPGLNAQHVIYVEHHGGVDLESFFVTTGGAPINDVVYFTGNANEYGKVTGLYSQFGGASTPAIVTNGAPVIIEDCQWPTFAGQGQYQASLVNSMSGTTASLTNSSAAALFTPALGTAYLVTVANTAGAASPVGSFLVSAQASGGLTITTLGATGCSLSNLSGLLKVVNSSGSTMTLTWSALRVQ